MPAPPYNTLRSKLNRAIAAYLVSAGAGTSADVVPANAVGGKGYPHTVIRSTIGKPEAPLVGIRRVLVHVSIKGSAVTPAGTANPESSRVAFDARCASTYDALMQTSDGYSLQATAQAITAAGRALAVSADPTVAANNADMADFTCQGWYDAGEGDGEANEEGCSWEEILMFEALASPSNVD